MDGEAFALSREAGDELIERFDDSHLIEPRLIEGVDAAGAVVVRRDEFGTILKESVDISASIPVGRVRMTASDHLVGCSVELAAPSFV